MGCFPVDFQEVKRPLRAESGKRPIKGGKRPIKEGKRPIKAMVLVGISVGCLMGCFPAPPPWRKTAPLKRPINPEGPKIKKIRDFDRDWKFRSRMKFSASHPPRPYFLWGNRDVEIEIFERDQKFRSRLKISIEIKFFWSLGPLGRGLWRSLATFHRALKSQCNIPWGPKTWKNSRSPSGIEIFKRDWNEWHFQARLKISSEPPTKPLFLWAILKAGIEKIKRDWSFQARLKISSENLKFSSVQARLIFFKIRALWVACSCFGNRAISGVCDGHRNRKSQKSLRFRCAKVFGHPAMVENGSSEKAHYRAELKWAN